MWPADSFQPTFGSVRGRLLAVNELLVSQAPSWKHCWWAVLSELKKKRKSITAIHFIRVGITRPSYSGEYFVMLCWAVTRNTYMSVIQETFLPLLTCMRHPWPHSLIEYKTTEYSPICFGPCCCYCLHCWQVNTGDPNKAASSARIFTTKA